jgi:hypothetical protein
MDVGEIMELRRTETITIECSALGLNIDVEMIADATVYYNGPFHENSIGSLSLSYEWPDTLPIKDRTRLVMALQPLIEGEFERHFRNVELRMRAA